jgi:hypothetical protein
MSNEDVQQKVLTEFGIEPGQIYLDNDKRMTGRRLKVLSVASKPGKAACSSCDIHGRCFGPTAWISFKRLSTKRLFTRIENP